MPKSMLGKLPLSAWQGPRDDFEQKLAGPDGPIWLRCFKLFLRRVNPFPVLRFPVFRTITLGELGSGGKLRRILKADLISIGGCADRMLDQLVTSRKRKVIDLVVLSAAELGFKGEVKMALIYARAVELGLRLCPAEVGPVLRHTYRGQPAGERLFIAMEPIRTGDDSEVFLVEKDIEARLFSGRGTPETKRAAEDKFVFVQPFQQVENGRASYS